MSAIWCIVVFVGTLLPWFPKAVKVLLYPLKFGGRTGEWGVTLSCKCCLCQAQRQQERMGSRSRSCVRLSRNLTGLFLFSLFFSGLLSTDGSFGGHSVQLDARATEKVCQVCRADPEGQRNVGHSPPHSDGHRPDRPTDGETERPAAGEREA